MRAIPFNGPIRTGRGTCLERALRFGRREAPIRCGFARTYVPGGPDDGFAARPTRPAKPTINDWTAPRHPSGEKSWGPRLTPDYPEITQSGALQEIGLARLHPVQLEGNHGLHENDRPSHDGRGPLGVQALDLPAAVERE